MQSFLKLGVRERAREGGRGERERGKEKLGDGARNGASKIYSQHNVRKDEWRRTRLIDVAFITS